MPETPTLTGYKNKIREYAAQNNRVIGERKIKTIARHLWERQVRMSDLDLEKILTYSDPTANTAVRNVMREVAYA